MSLADNDTRFGKKTLLVFSTASINITKLRCNVVRDICVLSMKYEVNNGNMDFMLLNCKKKNKKKKKKKKTKKNNPHTQNKQTNKTKRKTNDSIFRRKW